MTGVEILAKKEVVVNTSFNWKAFFILFGITLTALSLVGISSSINFDDRTQILIGIIVGTVFGIFFGFLAGFLLGIPTEFENQYKIIITDEVPMSEFTARYEILYQEGKIYTVREK